MNTGHLLDKLRKWVRVIQSSFLAVKLVELFAVVVIGYATNKATATDAQPVWSGVLITAAIVYIVISLIQTAYNYYFPSNIVDELTARLELEKVQKRLSRKSEIYEYLTQSIEGLNNQTCRIIGGTVDHLCDTGIKENIINVANPLFDNTNYIFECNKTYYTIGLYLNHYLEQPLGIAPPINIEQLRHKGVILLKDDWGLEHDIDKGLLQDSRVSGFRQKVKQAIETSLNNNCYSYCSFPASDKELCIFTVEVPEVCEDVEARGVLFVITEKISEPEDIEQVLRLFSRIISNLLSRQDECIESQVLQKNKLWFSRHPVPTQEPIEVQKLKKKLNEEAQSNQSIN